MVSKAASRNLASAPLSCDPVSIIAARLSVRQSNEVKYGAEDQERQRLYITVFSLILRQLTTQHSSGGITHAAVNNGSNTTVHNDVERRLHKPHILSSSQLDATTKIGFSQTASKSKLLTHDKQADRCTLLSCIAPFNCFTCAHCAKFHTLQTNTVPCGTPLYGTRTPRRDVDRPAGITHMAARQKSNIPIRTSA